MQWKKTVREKMSFLQLLALISNTAVDATLRPCLHDNVVGWNAKTSAAFWLSVYTTMLFVLLEKGTIKKWAPECKNLKTPRIPFHEDGKTHHFESGLQSIVFSHCSTLVFLYCAEKCLYTCTCSSSSQVCYVWDLHLLTSELSVPWCHMPGMSNSVGAKIENSV